jgi:hypothetical protein
VNALSVTEGERVLDTLRVFRDGILLPTDVGDALVRQYYAIAPHIVAHINASPNPAAEYDAIYRQIVTPTLRSIREDRFAEAVEVYGRGVGRLAARWLPAPLGDQVAGTVERDLARELVLSLGC